MIRGLVAVGFVVFMAAGAFGQTPPRKALRLAIAGLTHGHVGGAFNRLGRGDLELVGVYEPNRAVAERYAAQYHLKPELFFTDLPTMLRTVKPEAVAAFGPTSEHIRVVRACAPRGIHVMVEKPLALDAHEAVEMQALARKYRVEVITNYETSWYATVHAIDALVQDATTLGPIRKLVVRDGHPGPKEIGVQDEFLDWLVDPARNGGGAIMDFGCYGADLATRLMGGAEPLTVTAVTLRIKPKVYARVDDDATIVLTYPSAQAILEPSWNWTYGRKDMEVYGTVGTVHALDGKTMRVRTGTNGEERTVTPDPLVAPVDEPFDYLAAVVRGDVRVADGDLGSLPTNVTVMRILDAARQSARTGRTVRLRPARSPRAR